MKHPFLMAVLTFCAFSQYTFAQETATTPEKYTAHNKGKFFVTWGGNRANYTKSDIHFKGDDYNITVHDVKAEDKPKGYHIDYLNPARMTIPQTNLKFGYFITDHYNITIGVDHMKYVMNQNQIANVSGNINLPASEESSIYNGTYNNTPTEMTKDFLQFEHTDGLNYIHTQINRVDDISKWFSLPNTDKFQINLTEGIGGGLLYPKTNTTLLGKDRHDEFHVSGYGISAQAGINFTFFKHFFIQGELKGGYIDMQDIKTTKSNADSASQHFAFLERIISVGGIFRL